MIGNPTKESHALGSKVENIDLNDKTTKRKSAFQFKCKCARLRARNALRPAALCLFWLVSEVSYVQLGQRQFKYCCGHYLENFRKVCQLWKRERKGKGYSFGWLCFYDTVEDLQVWVFKVPRFVPLAGQEVTIGRFITFLTFNRTWFQNASPAKKLSTLINFVVLHWVSSLKCKTKRFRKILLKNSTEYVIGPY